MSFVFAFLLSLPRLAGLALMLPFTQGPTVPAIARNGLLFGVALVILPLVHEQMGTIPSLLMFAALMFKEFAIGAAAGFVISLVFRIPAILGDFVDNQRGASIASVFNPSQGDQSSNLGLFLEQVFVTWFLVSGGLLALLSLVWKSYGVFPVTDFVPKFTAETLNLIVGMFQNLLQLALLVSVPVVFAMMIGEIGLGLVGRFAKQLNVFFLSMSIKSMIALLIVLIYLPLLLRILSEPDLILRVPEILIEKTRNG